LLAFTTESNEIKFEKDKGKIKRKSLYRDWLTDFWELPFPKWRQESIKGYGNAIVPQVAYQIFKALMITETKARGEKNIITGEMHESSIKTGT